LLEKKPFIENNDNWQSSGYFFTTKCEDPGKNSKDEKNNPPFSFLYKSSFYIESQRTKIETGSKRIHPLNNINYRLCVQGVDQP